MEYIPEEGTSYYMRAASGDSMSFHIWVTDPNPSDTFKYVQKNDATSFASVIGWRFVFVFIMYFCDVFSSFTSALSLLLSFQKGRQCNAVSLLFCRFGFYQFCLFIRLFVPSLFFPSLFRSLCVCSFAKEDWRAGPAGFWATPITATRRPSSTKQDTFLTIFAGPTSTIRLPCCRVRLCACWRRQFYSFPSKIDFVLFCLLLFFSFFRAFAFFFCIARCPPFVSFVIFFCLCLYLCFVVIIVT